MLKQQAGYQEKPNGFTNIRLKRDRNVHFEDDDRGLFVLKIVKNKKISCRTENFQCIF